MTTNPQSDPYTQRAVASSTPNSRGASYVRGLVICGILALLVTALFRVGMCGADRNVHYLKIELRPGTEVKPALAPSGGESFGDMVTRLKPYAAINGTFYDVGYKPLGDVVIAGRLANRGCYRNAIAVKPSGGVDFLHVNTGQRLRWQGYTSGLAAGPRLIHNGHIALDPVADGFSRRSLTLSSYRSGVGKTKDGELLLVTTKGTMTLSEFAKTMLDLGAVEALNLDGGGASGLYFNGKIVTQPMLPMTNILMVCRKGS